MAYFVIYSNLGFYANNLGFYANLRQLTSHSSLERDYTRPKRRGVQLHNLTASELPSPPMEPIGVILPMDIVDLILSYGDPVITNRFQCVHYQLKYHQKEFDVLRHKPRNTYYGCKSYDLPYFILTRSNDKNQLNGDPAPTMPTTCALYYPRRWINTYISPPYDSDDSDGELPELTDHDDSDEEVPELML